MKKVVVFLLVCLSFFVFLNIVGAVCTGDDIILKLSATTNAHGEVWNGAGGYTVNVCYNDLFGPYGGPLSRRTCTGSNLVVRLYSDTNAHGESPILSPANYLTNVCYGDLSCYLSPANIPCVPGNTTVVSLSGTTNAHLSSLDSGSGGYMYNVCCAPTTGGPIPVNGQCASPALFPTVNCTSGTFANPTENSTHYLWQCQGSVSPPGITVDCSYPKTGVGLMNFTVSQVEWIYDNPGKSYVCNNTNVKMSVHSNVTPTAPGYVNFTIYECDDGTTPDNGPCTSIDILTEFSHIVPVNLASSTPDYVIDSVLVDDSYLIPRGAGSDNDNMQEWYFEAKGIGGAIGLNYSGILNVNLSCELTTINPLGEGCSYYDESISCNDDALDKYEEDEDYDTLYCGQTRNGALVDCFCLWALNITSDYQCQLRSSSRSGPDSSCTNTNCTSDYEENPICPESGYFTQNVYRQYSSGSCEVLSAEQFGCVDTSTEVPCRRSVFEMPLFGPTAAIITVILILIIYYFIWKKTKEKAKLKSKSRVGFRKR